MAQYEKVYVIVFLRVDRDGYSKPVTIEWEDGTQYQISKIIEKRQAPPRHVASSPTNRYTVQVQGRTRELYHETFYNKWFVEKIYQN